MNKGLKTLLLLLCFTSVFAQNPPISSFDDLSMQNYPALELTGNAGIQTNFLSSSLVTEDYWDKDIVNQQIDMMSTANRGGFHTSAGAVLHLKGQKMFKHMSAVYGIGHHSIIGAYFQKDLGILALEGNRNLETIDLKPYNQFQVNQYSTLSLGAERYDTSMSIYQYVGFTLSGFHQNNTIHAGSGIVEFDSSNEYIDFREVDMTFSRAGTQLINGFGFGLDYTMAKQMENGDVHRAMLRNVGLIYVPQSRTQRLIPNQRFDGFDVSNSLSAGSDIDVADSLNSFFSDTTQANFMITPFRLSYTFTKSLDSNRNLSFTGSYLNFSGYIPQISAVYTQKVSTSNVRWRVGLELGGFGSYASRVGVFVQFKRGGLDLFCSGIESLAGGLPQNATAQARINLPVGK